MMGREGVAFGARVVVLRRVRLVGAIARLSQPFWRRGRRTSVLPPVDVGRPTFDPDAWRKVLENTREVRRDSALGAAGRPGCRCPALGLQGDRYPGHLRAKAITSAPTTATLLPSVRQ